MTEFIFPEAVALDDRTRVKPIWSNLFTGLVYVVLNYNMKAWRGDLAS